MLFFNYFGEGNWIFDPKVEVWKINYYENKVKFNNENKNKNNDNEIKEII